MSSAEKRKIIKVLLDEHGRTYAAELGIKLESNTPSPLFRWCCASILFSARISADIALEAARALAKQGWTTAQRMADSTWEQRTKTLNQAGYARYDERTSRMLGESAEMLQERYGGDLRRLRAAAERDPQEERKLLKEFKGMGDVGVDIFFREVQLAWPEVYPFADRRATQTAQQLRLGEDAGELAELVSKRDFPRLVAALVRVGLAKQEDAVQERAAANG